MILLACGSWSQFHDSNIPKIVSLSEAKSYASRYSEVSFGLVNYEKDVFLFDNVDMNNPGASVGQINTLFHRRTKFLKDTTVQIVNIQQIEFSSQLSNDSIRSLIVQIQRDHLKGLSYWALMKKYHSSTCSFSSYPEITDELKNHFTVDFTERRSKEMIETAFKKSKEQPVLIIIEKEAHQVPAFYAISYNISG